MEKILFAKVEAWLVLLLVLLGALCTIGFGYLVLDAEREKNRFGAASQAALVVAEIPDTTKRLLSKDTELLVYSDAAFRGKPSGWSFPSGKWAGPRGYLLVSRYDGDAMRHRIELVSTPDMTTRYGWTLDADSLLAGITHVSRFSDHANWDLAHFREIHPIFAANGDLIVKDHYSPLMRVDPCGRPLWTVQSQVFHHSTEADGDGNLWIPGLAERHSLQRVKDSFREDLLTQVAPSGRILHNVSVPQLLMRNGYRDWLFSMGMYNDDPTHLNDIEPVLADGPYWRKGDVFVSLRNISTIMLYRPATGQIVWLKRGPWMSQHDVDVIDDHRISVYNNNVEDRGAGPHFGDSSQILVYDFATGEVSSPLQKAMAANRIRTFSAGLYTALPDGSALVEDVTDARMLIFRKDGKVAAEFVNRAKSGDVFHLGWTRFIDGRRGDAILQSLRKAKCDA